MFYYRAIDRDTFAKLRATMRKDGNIDPCFGFSEARWDDPLYAKADLSARIECFACRGRLLVVVETHYGPDYDGHATPRYHEIPATLVAYRAWIDRMQEESEGVDTYSIVSWGSHEIPAYWRKRGTALLDEEYDAIIAEEARSRLLQ